MLLQRSDEQEQRQHDRHHRQPSVGELGRLHNIELMIIDFKTGNIKTKIKKIYEKLRREDLDKKDWREQYRTLLDIKTAGFGGNERPSWKHVLINVFALFSFSNGQ